jgi:glutamate racemase
LLSTPDSQAILFGAETTVVSGAHKKNLVARGIEPFRMFYQACPGLAQCVEAGPGSPETLETLRNCVKLAIDKLKDKDKPLAASLNCTQYGFIQEMFAKVFVENGIKPAAILNPNQAMNSYFLSQIQSGGRFTAGISFEVFSHGNISDQEINMLLPLLKPISSRATEALKHIVNISDFSQFN